MGLTKAEKRVAKMLNNAVFFGLGVSVSLSLFLLFVLYCG